MRTVVGIVQSRMALSKQMGETLTLNCQEKKYLARVTECIPKFDATTVYIVRSCAGFQHLCSCATVENYGKTGFPAAKCTKGGRNLAEACSGDPYNQNVQGCNQRTLYRTKKNRKHLIGNYFHETEVFQKKEKEAYGRDKRDYFYCNERATEYVATNCFWEYCRLGVSQEIRFPLVEMTINLFSAVLRREILYRQLHIE